MTRTDCDHPSKHSPATIHCEETMNEPLNFYQAPGSMLNPPLTNHLAEDLLLLLWIACRHPLNGFKAQHVCSCTTYNSLLSPMAACCGP